MKQDYYSCSTKQENNCTNYPNDILRYDERREAECWVAQKVTGTKDAFISCLNTKCGQSIATDKGVSHP